jgi:excisionase family DNA binding protein
MDEKQSNLPLKVPGCVTPTRAAQMLSEKLGHEVSRQTVYRMIDDGRLTAHRVCAGGKWWIYTDSVHAAAEHILNDPPN